MRAFLYARKRMVNTLVKLIVSDMDGTLVDDDKNIDTEIFELLPKLEEAGEQYDIVILDPPAFTKSRQATKGAVKGYREINLRGMRLVKDGGFLVTCSCSHFMEQELFAKTIKEAARSAHKRLRQVEFHTGAGSSDPLGGG